MKTQAEQIKQAVSEHYAAKALRAGSTVESEVIPLRPVGADDACCVPEGLSESERSFVRGLYAQKEVEGLPLAALEAAAGCGNPTAIAELWPGEVVLDLGSGGGIDCFLAAKQVGHSGRVIGVDMTPEMVDLARRNASEIGTTNVEFRLGEIEKLPLADASVDVVISNCVVNLSTNKPAVFAEVARVLKPGGRFRVSDIVWMRQPPPDAEVREDWAGCIAGALGLSGFLEALVTAGLESARADAVRILDESSGLASALISAEKPA